MSALNLDTQIPVLDDEHLSVLTMLSEEDPKSFIQDLYQTYKENWNKVLHDLKTSCETKNQDDLRKAVHLLNGSSANIGLKRLCKLCRSIETSIHENTFHEFETCTQVIENEYKNSTQQLEAYIASI